MKRALVSFAVAFLVAVLVWLMIVTLTPTMNNEKAGNIIVLSSIATGIITLLVLRLRASKRQR